MKAFRLFFILVPTLAFTGCEQPQVIAEVGLSTEDGETLPLADLPVRLLPYDREAVLDSLESASSEALPPIPAELLEQQQQVQRSQSAWREAQGRLTVVRDSVRSLSERIALASSGVGDTENMAQLASRLRSLELEEEQVNQEMQIAFVQFDTLQQHTTAAADSIRSLREAWAQQAYADFNQVIAAKLRESGRTEKADTTDAAGMVHFGAKNGTWWVYARYTLPYEELYWNIRIETASDSTRVELTRENADVRPVL